MAWMSILVTGVHQITGAPPLMYALLGTNPRASCMARSHISNRESCILSSSCPVWFAGMDMVPHSNHYLFLVQHLLLQLLDELALLVDLIILSETIGDVRGYFSQFRVLGWKGEAKPLIFWVGKLTYGKVAFPLLPDGMVAPFQYVWDNLDTTQQNFTHPYPLAQIPHITTPI